MRILVADDDFSNRKLLEKILEGYGEVVLVDSGIAAVEKATAGMEEQNAFSLICLDIMMIQLDGYKALEAIRAAEKKYQVLPNQRAKIIMISALDKDVSEDIQVSSDYDAYLCKPIVLDKFEQLLADMGFQKQS